MIMTTGLRPRARQNYRNCAPNGQVNSMNLTNISESDAAYHIEIATPGWTKEEIKIEAKDGHLSVVANHQKEAGDQTRYHKRQFAKRDFKRSFILPQDVTEDGIDAKFENGVLYITLKKSEVAKNVKEIAIS